VCLALVVDESRPLPSPDGVRGALHATGGELAVLQARGCDTSTMTITGVHAVLYTHEAEADRAWLTDVLGLKSVDAGGGWLIFALPPAELAVHPASSEGGEVELYLMCDDIESTMRELRDKGVAFDGSVADQPWGRVTKIVLPSGGRLGLYEPRHASPLFR
jgi:predicted enzyme related to lactoylglutathione lyase